MPIMIILGAMMDALRMNTYIRLIIMMAALDDEFCREVLADLEVVFDVEIVLPSSVVADVQAERSKVSSLDTTFEVFRR